jgi:hypothetical protein
MIRDLTSAIEDKESIEEITTLHNNIKTNLNKANNNLKNNSIFFYILFISYLYQVRTLYY